jgi:hypothetical protein
MIAWSSFSCKDNTFFCNDTAVGQNPAGLMPITQIYQIIANDIWWNFIFRKIIWIIGILALFLRLTKKMI